MLWPAMPRLEPGETAVEIDLRDFAANPNDRGYPIETYKVARIVVGQGVSEHIRVKPAGGTCNQTAAVNVMEHLYLVGRLRDEPDGPVLVPRYMPYSDPIRIEAERLLQQR